MNYSEKNNQGNIIDFILLKRVLKFVRPYKKRFLIAAIAAISLSFLGPLRPWLINFAVDNYIMLPNKQGLINITILLIIVLLFEAFAQFIYTFLSTWLGQNVIQDLRSKTFKHILSLKMKYFDNTPIGTMVTRTVSDIETIADIFSQGLLVIMAEILKLLVVLLMMLYTDWKLTLITLITIPFLLLATAWFKKNIKRTFQDVRNQVSNLNTFVQEHIVGMHIVQIFNREEAEYEKFKAINNKHKNANIESIFYYAVFFPIVEILSACAIALIVWYGGHTLFSSNDITIGELIAFILYVYMMFRPIRQLADRFNVLQMGIVGAERVFTVLDYNEKIVNNGKLIIDDVEGNILFDNVSFSYIDNEIVLEKISFNIKAESMFALVGRTGSGKTTIVNIINRFYDINSGSIKIDGFDIKNINLKSLRKNIALVQQEPFLFSDSILNNVTLYDKQITLKRVKQAAHDIGVASFIEALPTSYDYVIGERGSTLSAGQRQLIAFLRVYILNPKILILDEATASIDTETEMLIQTALEKLSKNRTTIIIAHRLSTITKADKILHLQDGSVIEFGSHQELMKSKGEYAKMYKIQSEEN